MPNIGSKKSSGHKRQRSDSLSEFGTYEAVEDLDLHAKPLGEKIGTISRKEEIRLLEFKTVENEVKIPKQGVSMKRVSDSNSDSGQSSSSRKSFPRPRTRPPPTAGTYELLQPLYVTSGVGPDTAQTGKLQRGQVVEIISVEHIQMKHRGHLAPHEERSGWISLRDDHGRNYAKRIHPFEETSEHSVSVSVSRAKGSMQFKKGEYEIVSPVKVMAGSELDSKQLNVLNVGTKITIIGFRIVGSRIRGKLGGEYDGKWISVSSTKGSWAERIDDEADSSKGVSFKNNPGNEFGDVWIKRLQEKGDVISELAGEVDEYENSEWKGPELSFFQVCSFENKIWVEVKSARKRRLVYHFVPNEDMEIARASSSLVMRAIDYSAFHASRRTTVFDFKKMNVARTVEKILRKMKRGNITAFEIKEFLNPVLFDANHADVEFVAGDYELNKDMLISEGLDIDCKFVDKLGRGDVVEISRIVETVTTRGEIEGYGWVSLNREGGIEYATLVKEKRLPKMSLSQASRELIEMYMPSENASAMKIASLLTEQKGIQSQVKELLEKRSKPCSLDATLEKFEKMLDEDDEKAPEENSDENDAGASSLMDQTERASLQPTHFPELSKHCSRRKEASSTSSWRTSLKHFFIFLFGAIFLRFIQEYFSQPHRMRSRFH